MNAKDQAIEDANAREGFPVARRASSLYELVERWRAVMARIDEAEGEIDDAAAAELDALTSSLDERAEVIAAVCRSLDEEAEACKRLAKPYTDRASRKTKQADAMKARLKAAMEEAGRTKIATPTVTASIQKSPKKLRVLVPAHEIERHAPEQYLERTVSLRTADVKAALESGAELHWAELTQDTHLRLR